MQNFKILTETDELVAVPNAAKELKLHFSTISRWIKNGEVLSSPNCSADYWWVNKVQPLKIKIMKAS